MAPLHREWTYDDAPPVFYRRQELAKKKNKIIKLPELPFPFSFHFRFNFSIVVPVGICLLTIIIIGYLGLKYYHPFWGISEKATTVPLVSFPTKDLRLPTLKAIKSQKVILAAHRGDTIATILKRYGSSLELSNKVQAALADHEKSLIKPGDKQKEKKIKLLPGQSLEFNLQAKNQLLSLVFKTKEGSRLLIQVDPQGKVAIKQTELPKIEKEKIAVGVITSSFADAAAKSGVSYDLIDDMVDLFSNRVEFNKDLQPNDRFTLILSGKELEDGTDLAGSVILAAALSVNGKQMMAVRFVGSDGKARYFDETGQLIGDTFLRYPLKFSHISSLFSYARFHPILHQYRPHLGIDFAAPQGTAVRTVADGIVKFAGYKGANGLTIEIQHGQRYRTTYLHLSKINSEVRVNARIIRGQTIGAVGNTGRSTGPHLHYGFFDNGKYIDPLKISLPMMEDLRKGTKIDQHYLKRVAFTLQNYQGMRSSRPDWYQ